MPREDEWCLYSSGREQINPPSLLKEFPYVWTEKRPPSLAKNHAPIVVDLRPRATPVRQKQISSTMGGMPGNSGQHPASTSCRDPNRMSVSLEHPLLPVKKSGGNNYHPVQDLHAVNSAVITIHPVVPNTYYSPESLTRSGKLVHLPRSQGHILLPPAVANQPALVCC